MLINRKQLDLVPYHVSLPSGAHSPPCCFSTHSRSPNSFHEERPDDEPPLLCLAALNSSTAPSQASNPEGKSNYELVHMLLELVGVSRE